MKKYSQISTLYLNILICVLAFFYIATNAQSWQPMGPNDSTQVTYLPVDYTSMALDTGGIPYVAYEDHDNNDRATVRKLEGNIWVNVGQPDFTSGSAKNLTIVFSRQNIPFVAFNDGTVNGVTVMEYINGNWVRIGNAGFAPYRPTSFSLAIDTSGVPYLAYADQTITGHTTVRKYDGSSWVVIGNAGFSIGSVSSLSMEFNNSNTPYLAYVDKLGYQGVKPAVMTYIDTSWVSVGGAHFSSVDQASFTSLTISKVTGEPYVLYEDDGNDGNRAKVSRFNDTIWVMVGDSDFSAGAANYAAIALDNIGKPYVVYLDAANNNEVSVKELLGNSWVNLGSMNVTGCGGLVNTNIAINNRGTPYIAYNNGSNTSVNAYNGSKWMAVGNSGFSQGWALYTYMALSASGTPYVVYQDCLNGAKASVMQYDGSNWAAVGNVAFSSGLASYTTIAISPAGKPYVAFSDTTVGGKATVMQYNGSNWLVVGNQGFSVGRALYTSIAINSAGIPYVAYCDSANGYSVTVKEYNGTSWVTVGNSSFSAGAAKYTSLAISAADTLFVVYADATAGYSQASYSSTAMKFNGSSWVTLGVAGFDGATSANQCLAISSNGTVYESESVELANISVWQYEASAWNNILQFSNVNSGAAFPSIATSNAGDFYLVGTDKYNMNKDNVIGYNGVIWDTVGTSTGFTAGAASYNSIAVDNNGYIYVVYTNGGAWGYKYSSNSTAINTLQNSSELELKAYPNPFTGNVHFTVKSSNNADLTVNVYDLTGRIVEAHENVCYASDINVGNQLSAGAYLLTAQQGETIKTVKIIKTE